MSIVLEDSISIISLDSTWKVETDLLERPFEGRGVGPESKGPVAGIMVAHG